MNIFMVCASIPLVVLLVITYIKKFVNSKPYNTSEFIVRIPTIVSVIGLTLCLCSIITMICFSIFSYPKPHMIFYIVFILFMYLGLYLFIKTIIFRVYVKGIYITVHPLLSKQYTCTFFDIISVKKQTKSTGAERIIIRFKSKRKLILENSEICYKEFIDKLYMYKSVAEIF